MLGLGLYSFLAFGLGFALPRPAIGGRESLGLVLLSGYSLLVAGFFLLHVGAGLALSHSVYILMALAAAGIARRLWQGGRPRVENLLHPAFLLPLAGAAVVLLKGGIDYLPFTIDEFTNWIGVSRSIFLAGGYDAIRETVHLPGYTPGWRLVPVLPWLLSGAYVPGQSAAAPFVLHVGLIALFYDILRREADEGLGGRPVLRTAVCWLFVLVYLTAEATGRLWIYTLLIEQPQIYMLTALLFVLYLADREPPSAPLLYLYGGLLVGAGYLLKTAAISAVPGLLLLFVLPVFRLMAGKGDVEPSRSLAVKAAALFLPFAVAAVVWRSSGVSAAPGCLSSPLSTLTLENLSAAASKDWQGLLSRFVGAVATYAWSYKTPVLLTAVLGGALLIRDRRFQGPVVLAVAAAIYFGALYWLHLTCFGPFYFENLNSIPRFTRVIVQPFHALGMLAICLWLIGRIGKAEIRSPAIATTAVAATFAAVLALAGFQGRQLARTVEDVTTRKYQNVHPGIAEARNARRAIEALFSGAEQPPRVIFVNQGKTTDIIGYAWYFAVDETGRRGRPLFTVIPQVSWGRGSAANTWQSAADDAGLRALFLTADVIWPVVVDDWIVQTLRAVSSGENCERNPVEIYLIKSANGRFACRPKTG